ncbi:MAG: hypothetical protein K2M47_02675 [Clostridiales bacterium]|nr:hypothetical protein [Clostridiales bacterium]
MKLTKQSNRIKSRIVSFVAVIALILCAVLSLGYILPDRIARADGDGATTPAAKVTDGIRFVQVAAGYDFAIGLTYDRKLYGWSTKEKRDTSNMQSLGDYYSYDPTEIKVTFRRGASGSGYRWGSTGTEINYHTPRTDDKIKSIAATGTTAAFVTERGYLYTWGVDTDVKHDVPHNDASGEHYLLLRETDETKEYSWKVPYIIDYYYYGAATSSADFTAKYSTEQMIPTNDSATFSSLAAGEYNYILAFIRNYPSSGTLAGHSERGDMYHTYVWGSALYNAINTIPSASFSYSSSSITVQENGRKVFNTFISSSSTGIITAVAGGYTVGINNTAANVTGGTTLQLRGRNFITTQGVTSADSNFNVVNTAKLVMTETDNATNITWNGASYLGALAGGNSINDSGSGSLYGKDTEKYYARQAGSVRYNISGNEAGFLINSKAAGTGNDNRIESYQVAGVNAQGQPTTTTETALKPTRYAVALGNDIGYGIANSKLYGWGDNAYGQITPGVNGTNKDEPTAVLSSVNFMSVAAGKQKSKTDRAFFSTNTTFSGTTFADGVKNEQGYITGALTTSGDIYAWSNGISEVKQLTYMGISGNKKESFAAVYSGYGEILYAVTESGKLVRITKNSAGTDFEQYVYDEFYTLNAAGNAVKIDNWTVDKTNKVVFNVPTIDEDAPAAQQVSPYLGNATFYVWSATVLTKGEENADVESEDIEINGGSKTAYKPLVSTNAIGDAYRIIGLSAADASINYLKADNLNTDINELTYYAPKFYFDSNENGTGGSLMSTKQQQNMFTFREVYGDNGEGVGIYIEPKQSSKGKNIRVDFYIARYNSYGKFSNVTNGDNAIYYDYKLCSIIFSIADTPSVVTYSAYNSTNANKSNIPLLDPNNPYNKYYSIAVQDVSTGVNELIKFLTGGENVNTNFKTAVMTEMKKDIGFPDSEKVEKGDLTYYLNNEDLKKYNYIKDSSGNNTMSANDSIYQFMFTDRDSERIKLENRENSDIMSSTAVEGEIKTIVVKVEYLPSSYGITGVNADLTADNFGATLLKTIAAEFDNRYGLYEFKYTTEGGKNYLSFSYDVLTFTAKAGTGVIGYTGTATEAASVTDYNTVQNQPHATASFISRTFNKYTYTDAAGYVESPQDRDTPRENLSGVVHVFALPSLRLKDSVQEDTNGQASGSKNTYVETHSNTTTDPLYVGDTITIRLTDYVANTNLETISFAFSKSSAATNPTNPVSPADTASLAEFANQFKDFTGHNMRIVTLTDNTISVHPTTAAPINFTVEIQRFVNAGRTRYFKNGNDVDEKIYLTFNFNNIVGFNFSKGDAETSYTITKNTTIDLFGEGSVGIENAKSFVNITASGGSQISQNAFDTLKANVQIYGLQYSEKDKAENERLFIVNDPQASVDKTKFTITPKRSGTGTIVFSANVYDKSLTFKLTINVSAITELGDSEKISLIDYEYIPVSKLDAAIRSANTFKDENGNSSYVGYRILQKDVAGAIYFEDEDGNTGNPPFVDEVEIERANTSNATIRIKASNSSTNQSKTYKMYVRYTDAPEGIDKYEDVPADKSIIEIVIPISSGKVKLQDDKKGGDLVADIDCRNKEKADWWTQTGDKLNTHISIDLQYLLDLDKTAGSDKCTIFLLSADSAATKYFQYDKGSNERSIEITPKLNTDKNYELSVSVYNDSDKTTKVLTFEVSVKGILTELPVMTDDDGIIGYGNIWLYSLAIVFGVLFIIFMIRFIVYMRRRAKQRAIIKRNQELIRLRDRMHGKANAASREQLVKSKLKMEDPKYAKMFNDMRRDKEEESGVALVNSDLAATADKKTKKKKKKGGKKSVAELKAELAAKKAAFAAAQAGNAQPVNPFATEVPLDGDGFVAPDGGYGGDGGFVTPDAGFAADGGYAPNDGGFGDGGFGDGGAQSIDGSDIIFDASDMGDGNM